MAEEKLLTVREVASLLGISEKEVIDLAESGAIPAYKVGGVYLRFKKEQVKDLRRLSSVTAAKVVAKQRPSFKDRVSDFFYFNDFYILTAILIILLLLIIFQGN